MNLKGFYRILTLINHLQDEKENPNSKTGKGKAARIIYSESDSE